MKMAKKVVARKTSGKRETISAKSIKEAASKANMPYMTLYMRVAKLGWSLGRALSVPVRNYTKHDHSEAVTL
jgi:hypothetical protein